jgi:Na+-transporting methylmalonyl-CoA/oxaloacetate decarboxylase gamma subunit
MLASTATMTASAAGMAAATVRGSTTGRSAIAITMHIVSAIITTATAAPPPPHTPPHKNTVTPPDITSVAIITVAAHETHATRQDGQHHDGQPDFDPANQTVRKIQHRTLFDFHIR